MVMKWCGDANISSNGNYLFINELKLIERNKDVIVGVMHIILWSSVENSLLF
jgi:hypothetical protein